MKVSNSFFSNPRPKTGLDLYIYNLMKEILRPQHSDDGKQGKKKVKVKSDPKACITNAINKGGPIA